MSIVTKNISTIDSIHLVKYILYKAGPMSQLKVQKILYYIQSYHLAYFDLPLIEDEFQAWVHGPISNKIFLELNGDRSLYSELEFKSDLGQVSPEKVINEQLNISQIELIDDVIDELKELSGLELENMIHSEDPWINARDGYQHGQKCKEVIPKEVIRNYYKQQIHG